MDFKWLKQQPDGDYRSISLLLYLSAKLILLLLRKIASVTSCNAISIDYVVVRPEYWTQ